MIYIFIKHFTLTTISPASTSFNRTRLPILDLITNRYSLTLIVGHREFLKTHYLWPCGTCFPHVASSKSGWLKIWFRYASSSLILLTILVLGVLENSGLSLIIVAKALSGSFKVCTPFWSTLNSSGRLDLKAEYESTKTSGEACIPIFLASLNFKFHDATNLL